MSDGQLPRPQMKEIRLEELLGRDEIKINMKRLRKDWKGKSLWLQVQPVLSGVSYVVN